MIKGACRAPKGSSVTSSRVPARASSCVSPRVPAPSIAAPTRNADSSFFPYSARVVLLSSARPFSISAESRGSARRHKTSAAAPCSCASCRCSPGCRVQAESERIPAGCACIQQGLLIGSGFPSCASVPPSCARPETNNTDFGGVQMKRPHVKRIARYLGSA